MSEHTKPVKVTISDPETGTVLEEKLLANDYLLITAGNVHLKSVVAMGRTHMLAVGPPKKGEKHG
jgi:hypothetical protein